MRSGSVAPSQRDQHGKNTRLTLEDLKRQAHSPCRLSGGLADKIPRPRPHGVASPRVHSSCMTATLPAERPVTSVLAVCLTERAARGQNRSP
jgi:hypothetical protein